MAGKRSMQATSLKSIILLGILMTAVVLNVGCDDIDVFDETGSRFRITTISTEDNNSNTSDIDMFPSACLPDQSETITKATMTPTFQSDEGTLVDGYIYRIDVTFTLLSWSGSGVDPELANFSLSNLSILIPKEGGSITQELDLITNAEKDDYAIDYANDGTSIFRVTVRAFLTYTPDDPEENLVLPAYSFQINVGPFNNCS